MPTIWRPREPSCQIAHGLECHGGHRRDEPGPERHAQIAAGEPGHHHRGDHRAWRPANGALSRGSARRDRQYLSEDRYPPQQPAQRLEWRLPETAHEAIAGRIGEVQRAVADIGIAVPALRRERVLGHRVRRTEPPQERIIDAAIHMNEANLIELLMAGEAACRLARQAPRDVVLAGCIPPLAPGVDRRTQGRPFKK